jgi:hypothetical protein
MMRQPQIAMSVLDARIILKPTKADFKFANP